MNATLSLKNKVVTLLNRDIPPRRKKRIVGVEEQRQNSRKHGADNPLDFFRILDVEWQQSMLL